MNERGLQRVPSEVGGGDKIAKLVSTVFTGHVSDEGKAKHHHEHHHVRV